MFIIRMGEVEGTPKKFRGNPTVNCFICANNVIKKDIQEFSQLTRTSVSCCGYKPVLRNYLYAESIVTLSWMAP